MSQLSQREPNARVVDFVANLSKLDSGDRARLKRDAGKDMVEARSLGLFFRLLPHDTPDRYEAAYFLAATLYPLSEPGYGGCLGDSLRRLRDPDPKKSKALDRRFEILLDADAAQLVFRLRQVMRLLKTNHVQVDWQVLTEDLLNWNSPYRSVQKKWARAYFKLSTAPQDAQDVATLKN